MKQFIKSRMLPRIKMIMLAKHFMAYFSFCTFLFPIQYHYFAIFFFATSFITFLFSNSLFLFFFICRSGSCCFFPALVFHFLSFSLDGYFASILRCLVFNFCFALFHFSTLGRPCLHFFSKIFTFISLKSFSTSTSLTVV